VSAGPLGPELVALGERLSGPSVRRYVNPHTRFEWPERPPSDRLTMSAKLLSLAGHPALAGLTDEQRHKLSLLEAVHFFSLNVAGERELIVGLASRLHVGPLAPASEYLHHFVHEENAHSVIFGRFCRLYGGRVGAVPLFGFWRESLPGEQDVVFFARVLIFEEIADYFNVALASDDEGWGLCREINAYHHEDEVRHMAFGRQAVEDLWRRHAPGWPEEGRARVAQYLRDYEEATLRSYVSPASYRAVGLGGALALRDEVLAAEARREVHRAATRRVDAFLTKVGVFS
jgi:hypothetical protein